MPVKPQFRRWQRPLGAVMFVLFLLLFAICMTSYFHEFHFQHVWRRGELWLLSVNLQEIRLLQIGLGSDVDWEIALAWPLIIIPLMICSFYLLLSKPKSKA